jgi:hypothetical protein
MPITPTTAVNATTMTNNWSTALANPSNQQKLVTKYLNPKALFNANPAQAQASYQAGVTRAIQNNKYANGMANADTNQAATNMQQFGGTNWGAAGTNKKYKYAAVAPALANAITSVMQTVNAMPKGKGANNQARMIAFSQGMSAYYGKIKQ